MSLPAPEGVSIILAGYLNIMLGMRRGCRRCLASLVGSRGRERSDSKLHNFVLHRIHCLIRQFKAQGAGRATGVDHFHALIR